VIKKGRTRMRDELRRNKELKEGRKKAKKRHIKEKNKNKRKKKAIHTAKDVFEQSRTLEKS